MTHQKLSLVTDNTPSVLVVAESQGFVRDVRNRFFDGDRDAIQSETGGFHRINGHAAKLALVNDVVLFEARPDDSREVAALNGLLQERGADTVFLGLSTGEMSIGQARTLRKIGVDDVLPMTISPAGLNDVIDGALASRRRALVLPRPVALPSAGKVIAVAQARGGIGATTVAVNLACQLARRTARRGKANRPRVALLDLDIQFGNANVFLDLEDNGAFQRMVEDDARPDAQYLRAMVQTHSSGVDLISAPGDVIPLDAPDSEMIDALMTALQAEYDFVIVDLPRALVDWLEPVMKRAATLHIVTDLSIPAIRHARRLIDFHRDEQIGLPVRLIVNGTARPVIKSGTVRDAESVLDSKIADWLPPAAKLARKATDIGQPVSTFARRSPLGKSFDKLARATRTETDTAAPKQQTNGG